MFIRRFPMKHLTRTAAVLVLGMASLAGAVINLNSSRSNIYRLTYSTTLVTPAQATAILADLDKTPGMDEVPHDYGPFPTLPS